MRAKGRADARYGPSKACTTGLKSTYSHPGKCWPVPFLLYFLEPLHNPHCLQALLPALSALVPPGYPGQATFSNSCSHHLSLLEMPRFLGVFCTWSRLLGTQHPYTACIPIPVGFPRTFPQLPALLASPS